MTDTKAKELKSKCRQIEVTLYELDSKFAKIHNLLREIIYELEIMEKDKRDE